MAIDKPQIVHRAGALKQTNKLHKHGRHRSKGSISSSVKGRVTVKALSRKQKKELNREARKLKAEQLRRLKRDEILLKKRGLGGSSNAPFLVCLLPLHENLDPESALTILKTSDSEAVISQTQTGMTQIALPRFKKRYSFVIPPKNNLLATLDTLKICDTVVLLLSAVAGDNIIDEWANSVLAAAIAQALPTPCVALMDLESVHPKKRSEIKQNIQKLINKWLPDEKLLLLDKDVDGLNLLRKIGDQKQKVVLYRDRRPHLYAEKYEFTYDITGPYGTLKISGYLRGSHLSPNGLVHIPGLGDFCMSHIDAQNITFSFTKTDQQHDCKKSQVVLYADPAKQEQLISENEVSELEGEQTWPTAEDYRQAEEERKTKKIIKKIPKGWSDYQAAWIPDVDAELVSEDDEECAEDEDEEMEFSDARSEEDSDVEDESDFQTVVTESEVGVSDEKYDQEMDIKEEMMELEKLKAAKADAMFPDEIDTPQDTPARVRFQKYRGLESFRTSPWDPKENLPTDYARIFQFENFERTRKRVLKEQEELSDGVKPGWYVTVYINNVSQLLWQSFCQTKAPLILFGILSHEYKMSVLNVLLKRTTNYQVPIKSKERLIFQCGYRRFIVNPIFSEHTNGSKHKYLRFFQPATTVVATFYARIQFPPSPILCFKEINDQLVLVGTGNLLSVNPDRMIIKRIVLSGHPLKVHKRSAVVRFMFFNREDIKYFQPCKLRTKYGRIGHIKEPLGTHGHMKCVFNGQIKSQDTILLNLYKRVYPKWTYEECIVSCNDNEDDEQMQQ